MYLKIGKFEFIARIVRGKRDWTWPPRTMQRAVYCRTPEEFETAVRAAGIDIWQHQDDFLRAVDDACIEADFDSYVFPVKELRRMRNEELDAQKPLENESASLTWSPTMTKLIEDMRDGKIKGV